MYLNLSKLGGGIGDKLDFTLTGEKEKTGEYLPNGEALGALCIKGEARAAGSGLTITGEGVLPVRFNCDRCLAPVETKLEFSFFEELVCVPDDKCVDLTPCIREGIISAMPMKVLCAGDCKGLCPQCGKNLNEGGCECKTEYIDPRFDALRSLFNVEQEV